MHDPLDAFLGTWNETGQSFDGPFGPAASISSVQTYEWLPGEKFLIHRLDGHWGKNEIACVEIIGRAPSGEGYALHTFYNDGTHHDWRGRERDGRWTIAGDWRSGGETRRVRCTLTFDGPDRIHGRWEHSEGGETWKPFWESTLMRA